LKTPVQNFPEQIPSPAFQSIEEFSRQIIALAKNQTAPDSGEEINTEMSLDPSRISVDVGGIGAVGIPEDSIL